MPADPPDLAAAPSLSDGNGSLPEDEPKGKDGRPLVGAALKAWHRNKAKQEDPGPAKDKAPKNRGGRPSNDQKLTEAVAGWYALAGMGVSMMGGDVAKADGFLIASQADTCAAEWVAYSKENATVRRVLERMASGGALGKLIMAHAPIALGIAANHGAQLGPLATMFQQPAQPIVDAA